MENRFLPIGQRPRRNVSLRADGRGLDVPSFASSMSSDRGRTLARSLSVDQRALVVLIENGGVELGIPDLADKLLAALPQASLIPQSVRQSLIVFLRDTIKGFTDNLLESAELAINRYSG